MKALSILRYDGSLFFANDPDFAGEVRTGVELSDPPPRVVLMDIAAANAGLEFPRGAEFLARLDDLEKPDLEKREMFRGIFDGHYKLIRYFGMGHYNQPGSVEELLECNGVALYDLQLDPEEMDNLAIPDNPNLDKELLETMNAKLNALIETEIGEDKFPLSLPEKPGNPSPATTSSKPKTSTQQK